MLGAATTSAGPELVEQAFTEALAPALPVAPVRRLLPPPARAV